MTKSTRYFQLTPDILVEYNYNNANNVNNQAGDANDHIIEYGDTAFSIVNPYCSNRVLFWKHNGEKYEVKNLENNFVLPINKSESRFVKCKNGNSYVWNNVITGFTSSQIFSSSDDSDILFDTFRLHFTSRNYLGNNNYDGFIITLYVYDKLKNKIGLVSNCIKKTDDPNINENPVLINQKLYTTYFDFLVPNVSSFQDNDKFKDGLSPDYHIMDNTPIIITIYGIKSIIEGTDKNEYYAVEKLNSIFVPVVDKSNDIEIVVKEAEDGDYFEIYPKVDGGKTSFSDYLYNLSDGAPERYIVFHEVTLTEHFTDSLNNVHNSITHREQFIINAAQQISEDGTIETEINENELDRIINYRPVLKHSSKDIWFTIEVKTNIINTLDNTTTIEKGSCEYGKSESGENAKKYGKKMNRIYLGEIPAQVNVYNKRQDIDIDGVKITNASSNVKIENHQHSIIGFIECANVGVSIEQIPKEDIE